MQCSPVPLRLFGVEPAAGHQSLFGGSAIWEAGVFGTTRSSSPAGKALHLDVEGDHPHDHKVVFVCFGQIHQEVLFLWTVLRFCPETLLTPEAHFVRNRSYYLVPMAFTGFEL